MHRCSKCGEIKPLDGFYKNPHRPAGRTSRCRACLCEYHAVRTGRRGNNPSALEKERARVRLAVAKLRYSNPSNPKKKYLESNRRARKAWGSRFPERLRAQEAANRAVAKGQIKKPENCEQCGAWTNKLEKHHKDYSKPLDVVWLCKPCHGITKRKPANLV